MSEQDIIELLAHPRVRLYVQTIARHEARKMLLATPYTPKGYTTYERAAAALGMKQATIRVYCCRAKLHSAGGYVSIESVLKYAKAHRITLNLPLP